MKITLVASSTGWHSDQLVAAAKKASVELEIVNIERVNDVKKEFKKFGDVILWRSASISPSIDRTILLHLLKDKPLINHVIIQPLISYKLYQQKIVQGKTKLNGIPTFRYKNRKEVLKAIDSGELRYPFIQKPNLGSKGNNVFLFKTEEQFLAQPKEVKIKDQVYQNFIRNNGDYRVLILGGRVLGVMKRTAVEGSFLNNVSKGGKAERVQDEEIISEVSSIARSVAATLDLNYCGVDVIKNEDTGEYHFLEVNTAPQWQGFQSQFPEINVAEKIIELCVDLASRKDSPTFDLVREFYDKNYTYLGDKKFHYASRMYLWTKESQYRNYLNEIKPRYLGITDKETRAIIAEKLQDKEVTKKTKTLSKVLREEHFTKYPMITKYNTILFLNLFAENLYGQNIRSEISEFIKDDEFLKLYEELKNDKDSILVLATHAINYFYLLQNYFGNIKQIIEPEKYLELAATKSHALDLETELRFKIYILTHCIIGKSRFYCDVIDTSREIVYSDMCKFIEEIIKLNYFSISLDNKLEFLVCCKLCNYKSFLEEIIQDEAEYSLGEVGNFIVDKMNLKARLANNQFPMSEHRNVLYIMSNLEHVK